MGQRNLDALVVAIDGPSGSGKSTVARGVAKALGLRYLDTGAMYRAVTWLVLDRDVRLDDSAAIASLAREMDLQVDTDPERRGVTVGGTDVTQEIRSAQVTGSVSAVSAVGDVRAVMVRRQRELIGSGGIVVEGRDIGTTVAPDAPVKIFLTADEGVRAQRRGAEIAGRALDASTVAATEEALRRRDAADSGRAASPLTQAPDATVIDSTRLSADAVIARIVDLAGAVVASGAAS
ncbi:MAG TPA: (d)CMP kinase [Amnibacterium sp.]|nr:(d)CMP kinase [Amnibacterium sp.]